MTGVINYLLCQTGVNDTQTKARKQILNADMDMSDDLIHKAMSDGEKLGFTAEIPESEKFQITNEVAGIAGLPALPSSTTGLTQTPMQQSESTELEAMISLLKKITDPDGAMKEPQGFKKGYSIRNQVSPGSYGGIFSAGSDSYHRRNNERAEQRKRSNDAMMKRSRMKRETIISEREEQRAMMKRETILSEIAAEYHYNMSEREDPWRLDQGSQWRPLTSSDSDRLRCSAEDETDDNDIIRGYFVGTINGMFWFKPHDKRMGQFPVNYLISESWEEEFTREYPNIWLKHGVSYCFIDPHHLKRSSGA
jgi:hypothetical protein